MNLILPPPSVDTTGLEEPPVHYHDNKTHSSQWTIDIIYFIIRTSQILQAPVNGWSNPKPPGPKEDGRGYWAWQTRYTICFCSNFL